MNAPNSAHVITHDTPMRPRPLHELRLRLQATYSKLQRSTRSLPFTTYLSQSA